MVSPVQRVDRDAGAVVHAALDHGAGLLLAPDAVLRGEERDQVDVGALGQDVDVVASVGGAAGVVGDEPDAAAAHEVEGVGQEDVDAGVHARGCGRGGGRGFAPPGRGACVSARRPARAGREGQDRHERRETAPVAWKRSCGKLRAPERARQRRNRPVGFG